MNDVSDKLEKLVESIKTDRDELRVQLHLLNAEIKEEWEDLEEKWQHLEPKLKDLRKGVSESGEEIGAATSQLAEEIGSAYRRIRKAMR